MFFYDTFSKDMKRSNIWQLVCVLLVLALLFGSGYYLGVRSVSVTESTVVKYLPGVPVKITLDKPTPVFVDKGSPLRVDTVGVPVYVPVDTAAILSKYFARYHYELDFSTDTTGTFKVRCVVSENEIQTASADVVPLFKEVTSVREVVPKPRLFTPWVMVGTSLDLRTQTGFVGLDFRQKYKVGLGGVRLDDKYAWTINAGVNF